MSPRPLRSMTVRGRMTLALLVGLAFAAGYLLAARLGGPAGDDLAAGALLAGIEDAAGPGDVASGPPEGPVEASDERLASAATPLPDPAAAPRVPYRILSMLPPSARLGLDAAASPDAPPDAPVVERVEAPAGLDGVLGPLEVQYTVDPELTRDVADILESGHVRLGHVILLDPVDGRVLAYVSTDPRRFPPTRPYPMASLMKVVTAAAVLENAPEAVARPCVFRGSPWALSARLLDAPRGGNVATFQRALATSNNQCFARLAVHTLGASRVLQEIESLGILESPGPGHAPGEVDRVQTRLDLGELGSGLAGSRLPPLAAARLAAELADGQLVQPHWIERVTDANGVDLELPASEPRPVLDSSIVNDLRGMLVETTIHGTARRAFRGRNGRPLLAPLNVAGKTGSLSGRNPDGRYEWFIGVAPASDPQVAVAALVVNGPKWWKNASQIAAEVLRSVFCADGPCRPEPESGVQTEAAIQSDANARSEADAETPIAAASLD